MKKILTTILALTTAFTAGCTATREEPSPLDGVRGNAVFAQPVANTNTQDNSSQNDEKDEIADTMMRTINHESLPITVHVDATVEKLLNSKTVSTIKVKPHFFSQQDVDHIYEVLIDDGYFADVDEQSLEDTQLYSLIEKSITWEEKGLEITRQESDNSAYFLEILENKANNLAELYRALDVAQTLESFPAASTELHQAFDEDGMSFSQIIGFTEKNDIPYRLWISNGENNGGASIQYARFPLDWYYNPLKSKTIDATKMPDVDYEKAKIEAQNIADRMTDGQMVIAAEQGVVVEDMDGYNHIRFTFVRRTEKNAQMTYDSRYLVDYRYNNFDQLDEANYEQDLWNYERFEICMDDSGLQALNWTDPVEFDGVVEEQVNLLSLDQVIDVFENMFFVKNDFLESTLAEIYVDEEGNELSSVDRIDVNITKIKLGLARVQAGKKYVLIPVWDFFGSEEALTPEGEDFRLSYNTLEVREISKMSEQTQSKLTINAIDGSIVNRDIGY